MLIAALLTSSLAIAFWLFIIGPLQAFYVSNQERIQEQSALLSRLKAISLYSQEGPTGLAGVHLDDFQADYLNGEQDSLIVAELQTRLRAIVIGHASEFRSARALPAQQVGSHTYLGLRIQISGEMKDVHKIVELIQNGSPFLFVNRALLRVEERTRPARDSKPSTPPLLAELDIYGAKWPAGSSAK